MTSWPSAELKLFRSRWARVALSLLWWLLFALALAAVFGGIWRGIENYRHPTGFDKVGLSLASDPACIRVKPESRLAKAEWPAAIDETEGGCIAQVAGVAVAGPAAKDAVASTLDGSPGSRVDIRLKEKNRELEARLYRVATGGWYDLILILVDSLVAILYVAAALLLRLRRSEDPVARRISLAFVLTAHICKGPDSFWLWVGWPLGSLLALIGVLLITVTLPAYPNGVYVPRATRWLRIIVPVATVGAFILVVRMPEIFNWFMKGMLVVAVVGVGLLILRYYRMPAGLEKQQVKWAVFGLSTGFVLIIVSAQMPIPAALAADRPSLFQWLSAAVTLVNQVGLGLIPAGFAVSLMEYRLNDADLVVSKSLGYAIFVLIFGTVWTIVGSVVSGYVSSWTGNTIVATAISFAITTLVLAPARSYVLAWTEAKFQPALVRLRALPAKLTRWQISDTPSELAKSALVDIVDGVGATYAAVLGDDGREWRVLAANGIAADDAFSKLSLDRPEDRSSDPFPVRVKLVDQLEQPDLLAIGPRSDGATFSRDERSAIASIIEPLSHALEASALRERHIVKVEKSLAGIDRRLGRLERELAPTKKPHR